MGTYNFQVEHSGVVVYARTLKEMQQKVKDLLVPAKDLSFTNGICTSETVVDTQASTLKDDILLGERLKSSRFQF